jgi:hypothetical protein
LKYSDIQGETANICKCTCLINLIIIISLVWASPEFEVVDESKAHKTLLSVDIPEIMKATVIRIEEMEEKGHVVTP